MKTADERTRLLPCPFCGGPPVPHLYNGIDKRPMDLDEVFEEGELAYAHVFCHECGAQGPEPDDIVCDREHMEVLLDQAIAAWNDRGLANIELYVAGEPESLNLYPRPEEAER